MNAIPERMDDRIQKTVQHYMTEIVRAQAGKNVPVQVFNQEVVKETTQSLDNWLRKQESAVNPVITTVGTPSRSEDRLLESKQDAFEDEDPVVLMQRMQKQRDEQARSLGIAPAPSNLPKLEIRDDSVPSAMNPVPPQADVAPALLAPRPQDYIIPQEDIVKYRETEYNIFLTSSDRDWYRNTAENRYNFTVNFNTGTKRQGFPYNAALQERFRNIQRIEFVKVILPVESLATLPRLVPGPPSVTVDTSRVLNVFSLPFLGIRIAELNNNGFSTNPSEDNTFAIVQYDTTWSSDLLAPSSSAGGSPVLTKSGFTGFIPKFLKTQKVYAPTPLATLQKLSIRIENHAGELLSSQSDVWSVKRICLCDSVSSIGATNDSIYTSANFTASTNNGFLYVQTSSFFSFGAIAEGDTILFQGYTPKTVGATASDFQNYVHQAVGHVVVATAYVASNGHIKDGRNELGYSNVIVLQSRFQDPSTGVVSRSYFGDTYTAEGTFETHLNSTSDEPDQTGASLINLSRQTHVVLRIITREMDSTSNIRPDNV
jgi:hypothetical protein